MTRSLRSLTLLLVCTGITASLPLQGNAQNFQDRLFFDRVTEPNGAVWISDGATDSLFFTNGNLAKVDRSASWLFYMRNTAATNQAFGGIWTRHDLADGSEHDLFTNNSDYLVGYDVLEADTTVVISYSCAIYLDDINGAGLGTITSASCYDDGPDIRQSDSLIVFQNTQSALYTMSITGANRTPIPNTGAHDIWPSWSPDGQWIVFGRYDNANVGVVNYYKIKPNGDSLTALTLNLPTDTAHYSSNAVWSADGSSVIAAGYRGDGSYGLLAFRADGSGSEATIPTTAGDRIAFVSGTLDITVPETGIAELPVKGSLQPWPVPADDHVDLVLPTSSGAWDLRIIGTDGRLWLQRKANAGTRSMDLGTLAPGMYMVVATTAGGRTLTGRVIKR